MSFSQEADEWISDVLRVVGDDCLRREMILGEWCLSVPRMRIADVLRSLRDDSLTSMIQLMDLCGVDYPERAERFEVVYHLLSLTHNKRLRVKIHTDALKPVPSVASVYASAGWYEREAWDMYGVLFQDHTDLRRILTDYGFEGHPLRKDFPLSGFVETRYDSMLQRVVYTPLHLEEPRRNYNFSSTWKAVEAPVFFEKEKDV